jgi:hypothetical protein
MRVRELERLLIDRGAGAAKLDAVTRRLREMKRLPTGGRGPNAPRIGPEEAAAILIALAGSAKGAEADLRLTKLAGLSLVQGGKAKTLINAVTQLLKHPELLAGLREVRVGRTTRHAVFVSNDGRTEEFRSEIQKAAVSNKFYVEGVLPSQVLRVVADALKVPAPGRSP